MCHSGRNEAADLDHRMLSHGVYDLRSDLHAGGPIEQVISRERRTMDFIERSKCFLKLLLCTWCLGEAAVDSLREDINVVLLEFRSKFTATGSCLKYRNLSFVIRPMVVPVE